MHIYAPGQTPYQVSRQIHELMVKCDHEFLPPLSWRQGTGVQRWNDRPLENGVENYFSSVMNRAHVVTLSRNGDLAAFLAYYAPVSWKQQNYLYVSTAIVAPAYRGKGLTKWFATPVIMAGLRRKLPILAKTWSSNAASMGAMARFAIPIDRLVGDRGEEIDTVYWKLDAHTLSHHILRRLRLCGKSVTRFPNKTT